MKKIKHILTLLFILLPCAFIFSACSFKSSYITNIKPGKDPNTYSVTYSDGKTKTMKFEDNNSVYVTNIEKKEETDTETIFTVTFSNKTASLISCAKGVNGKDGTNGIDGDDFTLEKLKEYSVQQGYNDFNLFLKDYFSVNYENKTVESGTNLALRSAVSIFAVSPYVVNPKTYYTISGGAGVIYKMDTSTNGYSYILTNYHVLYSTTSSNNIAIDIRLFQYGVDDTIKASKPVPTANYYSAYQFADSAVSCEYVGGSLMYDIAVLKAKTADLLKNNERAQAAEINEGYGIGETAIAVGNPEAEGISVTSGIVSVVSEQLKMKGADDITVCDFRVMRIDTAVNGGNSGGGLFNEYGQLIGIVNAKVIDTSIENISYALPIDNVSKVANNIIYYHEKTHTVAKIKKLELLTYETVNSKAVYTYNEATKEYIIGIEDDVKVKSLKYIGTGLSIGDIINSIKINDKTYEIKRSFQLDDLLLTIRDGDKVSFNYTRGTITTNTTTFTVQDANLTVID